MNEQEPALRYSYNIPTLGVANRQIEILQAQNEERKRLELQVTELEVAENALLAKLGKEPRKHTFTQLTKYTETDDARAYREKTRVESLDIYRTIDIEADRPVRIERRHFVDLDMAGGYTENKVYVVQKSDDMLFIEKTTTFDQRDMKTRTIQHLVSPGMEYPLEVVTSPGKLHSRSFVLEAARLDIWQAVRYDLEDVRQQLETEHFIQRCQHLVGNQPLTPGRYPDENYQRLRIDMGNSHYMEVILVYCVGREYDPRHTDSPELRHIAITETLESKRIATNDLDVREGTYSLNTPNTYRDSLKNGDHFKRALSLFEAII